MWSQPAYKGPERRKAARWRPRPFRVLLFLLVVVAIGYTVGVLSLVNEESTLVLQAGSTLGDARPSFPYQQVELPRADGAHQFAWVMPQEEVAPATWVLYFHGNASTIASNVNISHYRELRSLGLSVCAPEYRGFAGLQGLPTEAGLDTDARAAYDYLRTVRRVPSDRIVLFGWSLGSGVAVDLATTVDHAAIILEGTPASQSGLSQRRYPLFPMRLLMRNPFYSRAKIDRIHSPMLFLHGIDDEVVPVAEGRRLFDAARTDKRFVELRGGHVNLIDTDARGFSVAIRRFLNEHGLASSAPERNGS